jgi:acyl-coenzyme A thioesterase PaaI-like protein
MTPEEYEKFQRLITESPFAELLGFEVVEKTEGRVALRLRFQEKFWVRLFWNRSQVM